MTISKKKRPKKKESRSKLGFFHMRLLLATNNPGKIQKIRHGLDGLPCSIVTSEELGLGQIEIEETGSTLEENARLKARGFFDAACETGLKDIAVLADDGGFEIDALHGEPGIYAKRWAGEHATDEEIIAYTMKRLEGVPKEQRTARFCVYQVLIFPDGREEIVRGCTEGWITEEARTNKTPGLPYSGILVVQAFQKLLDELTPEELSSTHRGSALGQIRAIIQQNISRYA
jgi:XTP/dITP diphosphohydrolase